MSSDEQNEAGRDGFGRRASGQTNQERQHQDSRRPDPGKVTLTSKLSPDRQSAVQRRVATTGTGDSPPQARSRWELTTDSWMDAAHRGATALSEESHAAVQARGDVDTEDPATVHRAAAAGVSGAGSALPYFDRIQAAFGGTHDLSQVSAHIGGEAAAASEHIGAQAYAMGNHVAFRSQPDLHTAAHEAAHVVQQRAGAQLAGGVGQTGDMYEQQADAVADAVVRGESVAPILDELAGTAQARHSAGASSVQLKGKGNAKKQREARDYEASWHDISAAAHGDEASAAKLDVAWIDSLEPYVVQEIDREFHEPKVEQEFANKHAASKDVQAIKASYDKKRQKLQAEAKARLVAAGVKKPNAKAINDDAEYQKALEELTGERARDLEATKAEERAAFDVQQVKPKAPMMVLTPPEEGVTRAQGRMLARADFMSWGILVFGSADRLKEHFRAIKPVPGTQGMYLHEAAAERYVTARAWFENTYPGYTFLRTTNAMQLRNRHQEGHTQGKLGHPLGISADFAAFDNPNQLGDGASQYMLRRFGGVDEKTAGANRLQTDGNSFEMTKEIGQATARGDELTARQLSFLDSVERGFNEMAATSRRFQASRAEQMPELRRAESLWFEEGVPALTRLRAAERNVESTRKTAARSLGRQLNGLDAEARQAMIDGDPGVQASIAARDAAQESFNAIQEQVVAAMQAVFEPWVDTLEGEVDTALATHQPAHVELDVTVAEVERLRNQVKALRNRTALDNLVARNKKAFSALDPLPEDMQQAKKEVADYLTAVHDAKWSEGEVRVKLELIRRLRESPAAVFGMQSVRDKNTGRLKHNPTVAGPTVMQYLERGFARDDEMPEQPGARPGGKDARGVFNAAFIKCMAMFGFNTLATWSGVDTMHFDFQEGFDRIQKHDLYSP
jgi:Domain of unknown function (DUF4157)